VAELYYAMTHAPEPLSDEYAHALSWEAATQRLEAAGCIPKEEYEKMQEALSSEEAGIEVRPVSDVHCFCVLVHCISIGTLPRLAHRSHSLLFWRTKKAVKKYPKCFVSQDYGIVNFERDCHRRF
jgi:hypothetical protein